MVEMSKSRLANLKEELSVVLVGEQQEKNSKLRLVEEPAKTSKMKLKLKANDRCEQQHQQPASQCKRNRRPDKQQDSPKATTISDKQTTSNVCAACLKPIKERYLLVALDKHWHEDCLKCACCDCRLGEVGSSLFTHSDKILCRRDFLRIFGQPGHCAACKKSIPPYELVMRANQNAYHMECFACQQCQCRFCVGDKFYLTDSRRIVCLDCHSSSSSASLDADGSAESNSTRLSS